MTSPSAGTRSVVRERRRGWRVPQLALAVAALGWCAPSVAQADAVPPPPFDCPPGTLGDTSHRSQWCSATTCDTDADCEKIGGRGDDRHRVCKEQPLCVEDGPKRGAEPWQIGRRVCETDANCIRPETCVAAKRCVLEDDKSQSQDPPRSGCSCAPTASLAPTWIGLAALVLVRRRRATRR